MHIPRTLAIVLAGGEGSRLGALTEHRAKPSLRVAGTYRLIDVALSNLANSHLSDVWLLEQYLPHALDEHLSSGRPWDLDRTRGGLRTLGPFTGDVGEGFAEGNSDSLGRQRRRIAEFDPELVLMLSADHLYTIDLLDVLDTHREAGADLTVVTTDRADDPSRHGVVDVDADGVVTDFWYKPKKPPTSLVATEIFCFRAPLLLEALEALQADGGLGDYGEDLLPHFVAHHRTVEHRLEGYWRDIGTVDAYWLAHQEILDGSGARLDDGEWPIRSAQPQLLPARVARSASVADSLLAAGSEVAGRVERSVISPRARVESGATVRASVLLDGAVIGEGAELQQCIVADGAQVPRGRRIGGPDRITLIGPDGTIDRTEPCPR